MFNYQDFFDSLKNTQLEPWLDTLTADMARVLHPDHHGKMREWAAALEALPSPEVTSVDLVNGVSVGGMISAETTNQLTTQLQNLHPWRKGPFDLFGIHIDTEWRSDWKWDRLKDAISPLAGRRVLDVGCGNGYHCWRMLGAGAKQVIGLDPFLVYVAQYQAVKRLIDDLRFGIYEGRTVDVLPVGIEGLLSKSRAFDTVFSMGVLYHRQSPFEHLIALRDALRTGGELVLETLVIDGKLGEVLVPEGRYAQMRNVWFIPSTLTLESWLKKAQFKDIRLVDVTPTTPQEQRTTDWMTFNSLSNFLDAEDASRTVEDHPAPKRAIFIARR